MSEPSPDYVIPPETPVEDLVREHARKYGLTPEYAREDLIRRGAQAAERFQIREILLGLERRMDDMEVATHGVGRFAAASLQQLAYWATQTSSKVPLTELVDEALMNGEALWTLEVAQRQLPDVLGRRPLPEKLDEPA